VARQELPATGVVIYRCRLPRPAENPCEQFASLLMFALACRVAVISRRIRSSQRTKQGKVFPRSASGANKMDAKEHYPSDNGPPPMNRVALVTFATIPEMFEDDNQQLDAFAPLREIQQKTAPPCLHRTPTTSSARKNPPEKCQPRWAACSGCAV
jgi:hypothetical protein